MPAEGCAGLEIVSAGHGSAYSQICRRDSLSRLKRFPPDETGQKTFLSGGLVFDRTFSLFSAKVSGMPSEGCAGLGIVSAGHVSAYSQIRRRDSLSRLKRFPPDETGQKTLLSGGLVFDRTFYSFSAKVSGMPGICYASRPAAVCQESIKTWQRVVPVVGGCPASELRST